MLIDDIIVISSPHPVNERTDINMRASDTLCYNTVLNESQRDNVCYNTALNECQRDTL